MVLISKSKILKHLALPCKCYLLVLHELLFTLPKVEENTAYSSELHAAAIKLGWNR